MLRTHHARAGGLGPRVLHLMEAADGLEPGVVCAAALRVPGEHLVVTVGIPSRGLDRPDGPVLGAPAGCPELAWRPLRALARAWRPALIQAWSHAMAALAMLAAPGVPCVVGVLGAPARGEPPVRGALRRRALERASLVVSVAPEVGQEQARAGWLAAGARDVRVLPLPSVGCPDVTPMRARWRAELGAGADDVMVGLAADPPARADARHFAFLCGLLFTAGAPVVGVLPRGVGGMRRAARYLRAHDRRWRIVSPAAPARDVLGACDLGCLTGTPGRGGILASWLGAAGVPVVMPRSELSTEVLGPIEGELVYERATVKAVGGPMMRLLCDGARRRELSAALRGHARARDAARGREFTGTLAALWSEAATGPAAPGPLSAVPASRPAWASTSS